MSLFKAWLTPARPCPVCRQDKARLLDTVDFSKSCEEANGKFLPRSGIGVDYFLCGHCGFCFAPEFRNWTVEEFERRIYNDDYVQVDPDYTQKRPEVSTTLVDGLFGSARERLAHLDYGSGSGLLSRLMRERGWNSKTYDPFVDRNTQIQDLGEFDLVTAFEVFEHVSDIAGLLSNLDRLLKPEGLLLFSTLLSDGNIARGKPLTWWYASPRNGHISLFSEKSLLLFMAQGGFDLHSLSAGLHLAYRDLPAWARHLAEGS